MPAPGRLPAMTRPFAVMLRLGYCNHCSSWHNGRCTSEWFYHEPGCPLSDANIREWAEMWKLQLPEGVTK
jgi:hypothetical protein